MYCKKQDELVKGDQATEWWCFASCTLFPTNVGHTENDKYCIEKHTSIEKNSIVVLLLIILINNKTKFVLIYFFSYALGLRDAQNGN